jgi:hypothetical protein
MSSSAEVFANRVPTPSRYHPIVRERAKTWIVPAAVLVIALGVVVEAGRDGGAEAGTASGRLRSRQLVGSILYATPSCAVRRLSLATLRSTAVTHDGGHCRFWPSPDGRRLAMHVGRPFVRPAPIQVLNLATGASNEPFGRPDLAVAPPAWSPGSDILAACDARTPGGRIVEVRGGRLAAAVARACFPGYVGGKLAYRRGGDVMIGFNRVADAGTLSRDIGHGVYQVPGIAAEGDVLAIPATRIATEPGSATTTIVFMNALGRPTAVWHTGVPVREIGLTGNGRYAWYRGANGVVLRAVSGGPTIGAGLNALCAVASPDGRTIALTTGRALVFVDAIFGRTLGRLPLNAGWLAWLDDANAG